MKPECIVRFTDRSKGPVCILRYRKTSDSQHELLEYGFQSFYWLLDFGATLNATKFANLIATHYSAENPKTAVILAAFRQVAEQIGETKC